MREHPIPQDVTGYRFHLVGDMTLKQFGELSLGIVLALLFYKTNLIAIIKYPLVGLFVFLGFALAFVPFEERPLDHWIITFFKVLYKPTKFYWLRTTHVPDAFSYQAQTRLEEREPEADLSPARRQKIKEFLESMNEPQQALDEWDRERNRQVSGILSTFDEVDVPVVSQAKATNQRPNLKVRVRSLKKQAESQPPAQAAVQNQTSQNQAQPLTQSRVPANNQTIQTSDGVESQGGGEVFALQTESEQQATQQGSHNYNGDALAATVNKNLPFPNKPSQPNKIVGMVIGPEDKIIDRALIEIKNQNGRVVRAIKTNSLGQFFVSSSLDSGFYFIRVQKDGYEFPVQKINLTGQIVEPLEIRGETIS